MACGQRRYGGTKRHGGVDAELARGVGRRRDHAALVGLSADDHGLAAEARDRRALRRRRRRRPCRRGSRSSWRAARGEHARESGQVVRHVDFAPTRARASRAPALTNCSRVRAAASRRGAGRGALRRSGVHRFQGRSVRRTARRAVRSRELRAGGRVGPSRERKADSRPGRRSL